MGAHEPGEPVGPWSWALGAGKCGPEDGVAVELLVVKDEAK